MIEGFLQKNLIEILLSVILMFNVGAYSLLQREINTLENEQIPEIETNINENLKTISRLMVRIFGFDEDDTAEGHLKETEKRFNEVDKKLEKILQEIEQNAEKREEQYSFLEKKLIEIVKLLSEEEELEFTEDDIEL